jgi:hypothetical protein
MEKNIVYRNPLPLIKIQILQAMLPLEAYLLYYIYL